MCLNRLPQSVAVSLGAPILQLINFIFSHLFLNVLSDENAAGGGPEVLTWQTGFKKGEVRWCQTQDFVFIKLTDLSSFLIHVKWELTLEVIWAHMVSLCRPPVQRKTSLVKSGDLSPCSGDKLTNFCFFFFLRVVCGIPTCSEQSGSLSLAGIYIWGRPACNQGTSVSIILL